MTTDTIREVLLPCPFCGGEAEIDEFEGLTGSQFFTSCGDDRCVGFIHEPYTAYATKREAIKAWNTRTTHNKQKLIEVVRDLKALGGYLGRDMTDVERGMLEDGVATLIELIGEK